MGVRGLTSFIAKHAEQYLRAFELHDTDLVIDGDNLAYNLYKDVTGSYPAFGGDYDSYYSTVVGFFQILAECNIRSYVLFDGGYEYKKIRTVVQRLRGKICVMKHIDPCCTKPIFPLMMREVFIDAANDCGIKIMRCLFEADDEIAALARRLNCPVLSYDSDFYIHNVQYIPFITLTMKVLKKKTKDAKKSRNLRRCEAKKLQKRQSSHNEQRFSDSLLTNDVSTTPNANNSINFLDCCIYRVEHLIDRNCLSNDMLPLFAALLGNDYIESRVFRKFYSKIGLKGVNKKIPKQQIRVSAILRWLKHETKESAMEKILSKLKMSQRKMLLTQMNRATNGYTNEYSEAFEYFGLTNDTVNLNKEQIADDDQSIISSDDDSITSSEEDYLVEEDCTDSNDIESVSSLDENLCKNDDLPDSDDGTLIFKKYEEDDTNDIVTVEKFPLWFKQRYQSGALPRFFTDLLHLKLYINNPQIEHFTYADCNNICIPILMYMYSLLYYPNEIPEMRYLTRLVKLTNVHYVHMKPEFLPPHPLNPEIVDMELFKPMFTKFKINSDKLFLDINKIPDDLRLYFLSLVYWSNSSKHSDKYHLYSLIISTVVLRTIGSKIELIRNEKQFEKKFGKIIQKERLVRSKLKLEETDGKQTQKAEKIQGLLSKLNPVEKIKYISKGECILVQNNLLKYFKLQEMFKKRFDEFSTVILHGFSELQSVALNMYALNALLNNPFKGIRMSEVYNGMFLYNIHTNLKTRQDVDHYIRNFLFADSPILFEFYEYLLGWCQPFMPSAFFSTKLCQKKKKRKQKTQSPKAKTLENVANDMMDPDSDNDNLNLNNRFCMLNIK